MISSVSDVKGQRNPHAERNNQRRESHPRIESKRWLHFQREESGRRRNAIRFEVSKCQCKYLHSCGVAAKVSKEQGQTIVRRVREQGGKERAVQTKQTLAPKSGRGGRYASVVTSSGQNFLALPLSTYQPKPVIQLQDSGEH
jgi:hypothetical protein